MEEKSNFFSLEQGFNNNQKNVIKMKNRTNEENFVLVERKMKLPILSPKFVPKYNLRIDNEQYYEPIKITNVSII